MADLRPKLQKFIDPIFIFFWYWLMRLRGHTLILREHDNGLIVDVLTPFGIKRKRRRDL